MRTYLMKIKDKFINAIVSGQKIHEYRLNDNERRKIKCNDSICRIKIIIHKTNKIYEKLNTYYKIHDILL